MNDLYTRVDEGLFEWIGTFAIMAMSDKDRSAWLSGWCNLGGRLAKQVTDAHP
jgi:hypothetical protein